jgi:tRNA (cmo5U34)-methyltransferase
MNMKIPSQWTFKSTEIANNFDSHVREQLPWYDLATHAVAHIGRHYIPQDGIMYDIGASTGNIGRSLASIIEARNIHLVAIDNSADMMLKYDAPGIPIVCNAVDYDYQEYDFAVCMLTIMFLPINERREFLANLYSKCKAGGALVIIDKIITPAGYIGTCLRRLPMDWKLMQGASPEDIIKKEISLSGYQRPINPDILPGAPVKFFQMGEFCGWVIEKME